MSADASAGRVLTAGEFYGAVAAYMAEADPGWEAEGWRAGLAAERAALDAALGPAAGRTVLDPSCGTGGQAIPLAQLGWRVTALDLVAGALATASARARQEGVAIETRPGDMRDLAPFAGAGFDAVVSCMALDNIAEEGGIARALGGMFAALRPGGRCYLRLRDFDHLLAVRPRYEVKEERAVPHGRIIRLEDWAFEGETHAVCTYIFLREDARQVGYRWRTDLFAYRRRALRKAELAASLRDAGFAPVTFLPQPSPWGPYAVVAEKPLVGAE
jgi:SAM-dependent methyltransferase